MRHAVTEKVRESGKTNGLTDEEFKVFLYEFIGEFVQVHKTGHHRLSKPKARQLLDHLVELVFKRAIETGYFRFPGGYGAIKLVRLKPQAALRTMPDGSIVKPLPYRYKLRLINGVAVQELLGTSPHKYRRRTPRKAAIEGADTVTV